MELQQLHYFLAAAKMEHISKAAQALHIAQPALTQSIKRLENELGISLFDRVGRGIRLSDSGRLLQKRLIPVMAELDAIQFEFEHMSKKEKRPIHLNVSAGSEVVTQVLISYQEKHPTTRFHIMQGALEEACDITIDTVPYSTALSTSFDVFDEEIFLAVPRSSPFASYRAVRLDQLSKERFISLAGSRSFRAICDMLCDSVGFIPKIVFESDSPTTVRNLIEAGTGISFWPHFSWGEFNSDRAVLIPIGSPVCRRKLVLKLSAHARSDEHCMEFYRYLCSSLRTLKTLAENKIS